MNPDLLDQLRDIHSAPPPTWWPPAPGWWALTALLLVLLTWLGLRLYAIYKRHRRRQRMLAWIDQLTTSTDPHNDPGSYLATLNRVFKLVAIRAFPGQHCELMSGCHWSQFINDRIRKTGSGDILSVLASGPYDPAPQFDPHSLSELARVWIRQYG